MLVIRRKKSSMYYSEVPNKQADQNKQADGHCFENFINEQTGINEYARNFLKI